MKRCISLPCRASIGILLLFNLHLSAALEKGGNVPAFSLQSTRGQIVTNQILSNLDLGVLYFFSSQCKPCVVGLPQLQEMIQQHGQQRLKALAISKQDQSELIRFAQETGIETPMYSADEKTIQLFGAAHILPTTYIVGGDGKILSILQGGGASPQLLLADLAERQLQRNRPDMANTFYQEAINRGETSARTKAGIGYAALKEGRLAEAAQTFKGLVEGGEPETILRGKEGLAATLIRQGNTEQAEREIDAVIAAAPERSPGHLMKGRLLYRKGDKKAAEKEIQVASSNRTVSDYDWQRSEASNTLGNLQRQKGEYKTALTSYQQASNHNPYSVAALSNQGVTLQEMGQPERAVEIFKKVKYIEPNDKLVGSLLRQAQLAIEEKRDARRQNRIDKLVKDLIDRHQKKTESEQDAADDWTTRPIAVSIIGFSHRDGGDLMERAGLGQVFEEELTRQLQTMNIKVVDRAVLDKVLSELNLGSSELADPDTALELGRILAARLIATGKIYRVKKDIRISLRIVDTETTDIVLPLAEMQSDPDPDAIMTSFAKSIAGAIHKGYPLKGRIALIENDTIIINLGNKHNVMPGMVFNVLGNEEPIELNGRILGYRKVKLGRVEVSKVEDLMAFTKVQEKNGDWEKNQKIILKE